VIITIVSTDKVNDLVLFEAYIHQRLGTPFSTVDDRKRLGKWTKEFFAQHPKATWRTLCRIVDWAKDHGKRPARSYYVQYYAQDAWKARYTPELDRNPEAELASRAAEILRTEQDPHWREQLMRCSGAMLAQAISNWEAAHVQPKSKARKPRQPKQLSLDDTTAQEKPRVRRTRTRVHDVEAGRPADREG
jgi:hypothetical protein